MLGLSMSESGWLPGILTRRTFRIFRARLCCGQTGFWKLKTMLLSAFSSGTSIMNLLQKIFVPKELQDPPMV